MNFFQSLLSDDPDPPNHEKPQQSDHDSSIESQIDDDHNPNDVAQGDNAGIWSFGGLIKDLTTRSESVIESYRRDLEEFGSGLKKETEIFREVASRAVKDLPTSIEAGASAAQGALDGVLKSTAEIIAMDRMVLEGESEVNRSVNPGRYSWFESQLSAIQSDLSVFREEPEDVEEYKKWRLGFELGSKRDEIESLIGVNGRLEGVYREVVPSEFDRETFWCRYFYRVEKLKQQEIVRSNLVKRAIPVDDDDDELTWDFDDDEEEEGNGNEGTSGVKVKGGDGVGSGGVIDGSTNPVEKQEDGLNGKSRDEKEGQNKNGDNVGNNTVIESDKKSVANVSSGEKEVKSEEVAAVKSEENVKSEDVAKEKNAVKVKSEENEKDKNDVKGKPEEVEKEKNAVKAKSEEIEKEKNDVNMKSDEVVKEKNDVKVKSEEITKEKNDVKVSEEIKGEPVAKTDAAVASSHQSKAEEDDLEWDEIEDTGSGDEKKISATTQSGSPNRADLRKRLSVAEDDEDLSWDIEDDDVPVKS